MTHKKYVPALIAGVVFFLLIILAVRFGKGGTSASTEDAAAISQGVSYLQSLEAQDPDTVDNVLKQQRLQHIQEMRDERLRQLETGEISVWSLFDDYVLLGDSRAVGFSFYGFLPDERVIAESGATILHLEEHIPDIVALNPSNIFLCYGLNDVSIGIWPTPESYVEQFSDIIAQIQSQLPDANIFISSILPARDPAFQQSSAWYNIPEYSQAVSDMCSTTAHCYFVDNDAIAEEYANLWEDDGIHVRQDFYPHWAANLITEVYSASLDDGSTSTDTTDTADTAADTSNDTTADPTS